MDSSPHLWFCAFKTATFRSNSLCIWVPDLACDLLQANSVPSIRITSLYGSPLLSVLLCMQNSDFMTRHTSLYGSQTSSVVLSTHNSVLSTRIKRLYWFQPSLVVFSCKRASSGPEKQVSTGPRHDLSFYARTTACLASEILVSMGPSLHLWFLSAKQRLLDQNYKSLWVLDLTCRFVHAIQRD